MTLRLALQKLPSGATSLPTTLPTAPADFPAYEEVDLDTDQPVRRFSLTNAEELAATDNPGLKRGRLVDPNKVLGFLGVALIAWMFSVMFSGGGDGGLVYALIGFLLAGMVIYALAFGLSRIRVGKPPHHLQVEGNRLSFLDERLRIVGTFYLLDADGIRGGKRGKMDYCYFTKGTGKGARPAADTPVFVSDDATRRWLEELVGR